MVICVIYDYLGYFNLLLNWQVCLLQILQRQFRFRIILIQLSFIILLPIKHTLI